MKSTQSEPKSPGAMKNDRAEDNVKGGSTSQRAEDRGKAGTTNQHADDNMKSGTKSEDRDSMKAEGRDDRDNNMKAEGRDRDRDNNMKAEGRDSKSGTNAAETKSTTERSQTTTGQAGAGAKLTDRAAHQDHDRDPQRAVAREQRELLDLGRHPRAARGREVPSASGGSRDDLSGVARL